MTDDEKLALLNVSENDGWVLIEEARTSAEGLHALDIIERCQRIRANIKTDKQREVGNMVQNAMWAQRLSKE